MTDPLDVALSVVEKGGAYCSPLLLLALAWMERDRRRLLESLKHKDSELKIKDTHIMDLAERIITVATELKTYLFNERKA